MHISISVGGGESYLSAKVLKYSYSKEFVDEHKLHRVYSKEKTRKCAERP